MHPLRCIWRRKHSGESPSDISSFYLQRAYSLIGLNSQDNHAVWHLLLAAHLYKAGRREMGEFTLQRLLDRAADKKLSGWRADFALFALQDLLESTALSEGISKEDTEGRPSLSSISLLAVAILQEKQLREFALALDKLDPNFLGLILATHVQENNERRRLMLHLAKARYVNDSEGAQSYFQTAYDESSEQEDNYWRDLAYMDIVRSLAEVGDFEWALKVARKIQDELNIFRCYGDIAAAIEMRKKDEEVCGKYLYSPQTLIRDIIPYFEERQNSIERIGDVYKRDLLSQEICVAWAKAGQLAKSLSNLYSVRDSEREKVCCRVIEALIARGDLETAEILLKERAGSLAAGENWRHLAKGYLKRGETDRSRKAYRQATKILDALTCEDDQEEIRQALANVGIAQARAGFCDDAVETTLAINDGDWNADGWMQNVEIYTAIVKFHKGKEDIQAAIDWLMKIPLNNSGAIAEIYKIDLQNGVPPDEEVFHRIEHLCRRSKEIGADLALVAARACRGLGWFLDSYEPLARALAEHEEEAKAWQALAESMASIGEILIRRDDLEAARTLLTLAAERSLDYQYGHGFFKDILLTRIAHLQLRASSPEGARSMLKELDTKSARESIETEILRVEEGYTATLDFHPWHSTDLKPKLSIEEQIRQAERVGYGPEGSELWLNAGLAALREELPEVAGQCFSKAVEAACQSEDDFDRQYALTDVLQNLAEAGEPSQAWNIARSCLTDFGFDADDVLQTVSREFWLSGQRDLSEAVSLEIRGNFERIENACEIALLQFQSGEEPAAQQSLTNLFDSIKRRELNNFSSLSIEKLAISLCQIDLPHKALELCMLLRNRNSQETAWIRVGEELAKQEDKSFWKQLFLESTELDIAPWGMCGQLAEIYPAQAKLIGDVLSRYTPGRSRH